MLIFTSPFCWARSWRRIQVFGAIGKGAQGDEKQVGAVVGRVAEGIFALMNVWDEVEGFQVH